MRKVSKKLTSVFVVAMGLMMLGGCGKKQMTAEDMINKYADKCQLGEYMGIEYDMYQTEVTDDMVQQQVLSLLQQYASTETVTSGTVATGDTINIDFVGTIDGEEFDGGSTDGAGYSVTVGEQRILFDDQLAGHDVGETFNATITFPEDYGVDELNGKEAVFAITINSIENTVLPTYTDDFVATYTESATIDEYETQIKSDMVDYYAQYDEYYNKSSVTQVAIDKSVILSYPEQELKKLTDDTIASIEAEATSYGYTLDVYVTARFGFSSEDDFREYIADVVSSYMQEKIVICAIAKAENITVSKDEVKEYKQTMIENSEYETEAEFDENYSYDDVLFAALEDKVASFLVENAKGTVVTETAE